MCKTRTNRISGHRFTRIGTDKNSNLICGDLCYLWLISAQVNRPFSNSG